MFETATGFFPKGVGFFHHTFLNNLNMALSAQNNVPEVSATQENDPLPNPESIHWVTYKIFGQVLQSQSPITQFGENPKWYIPSFPPIGG